MDTINILANARDEIENMITLINYPTNPHSNKSLSEEFNDTRKELNLKLNKINQALKRFINPPVYLKI